MEENNQQREKKENNLMKIFIIIGVLLLIIMGAFAYFKNVLPEKLMEQGKQELEAGNAQKALSLFEKVENARPYEKEPIYYQALALSKLPPTYDNQKALYEIAQLDNCDEASELAEKILMDMRNQLDQSVGSNYIDNVLYENQLIRWNNSKPINYYIQNSRNVSGEYLSCVNDSINKWQQAINGILTFNQVNNYQDANIVFDFVDDVSSKDNYEPTRAGLTTPVMNNETLMRMEVKIKPTDDSGNYYSREQIAAVVDHELGHALGLFGHSSDPNDIMYIGGDYISRETYNKNVTNRDFNTLSLLYRMVPDVIDQPINDYNGLYYHFVITDYPGENYEHEIQRLIGELRNDRRNIVNWVDLAINYGYKRQYARSNYILNNIMPLVTNDLHNQFVVLYNLAANYYKMKDYNNAEIYLNHATNLQEDLDTQILEAFLDLRLNRTTLGREKLIILNKTYPDNIEIALKLASIYYNQKDNKKEKEIIERLITNNPDALRDRRVLRYQTKSIRK